MMRVGIPDYRLPKGVLQQEIDFILAHGVDLKLNTRVGGDVSFEDLRKKHDAVYIATGLHLSRKLGAEGQDLEDVIPGHRIAPLPQVGRRRTRSGRRYPGYRCAA
jgi:NADH-quinone oxidoreductase subunit F